MTTLDTQAALITEVKAACRKAKDSKDTSDLEAARLLMVSPEVEALPFDARENLRWAYADALLSVTGALS